MFIDLEDRVLWTETKNEKFFVKSLYVALELGGVVPFPRSIIWNPCEPSKVGFFFFCLGRFMGIDLNFGSSEKEGVVFSKQMFPLPHR